jgi:hypothetical protein
MSLKAACLRSLPTPGLDPGLLRLEHVAEAFSDHEERFKEVLHGLGVNSVTKSLGLTKRDSNRIHTKVYNVDCLHVAGSPKLAFWNTFRKSKAEDSKLVPARILRPL